MTTVIPLADRFWKYVAKGDGCWEWQGARLPSGYGVIRDKERTRRAHRVSWELHHGPIPGDLLVCHECDNKRCVNPEHLFLGDWSANLLDRHTKFPKPCCKNGHVLDAENARRVNGTGRRICRECERAAVSRYLGRKKAV